MKVALLADIHGNPLALAAALAALADRCTTLLFLGDLAGYYPFVEECFTMLRRLPVISVRGNHDEVLLSCLDADVAPPPDYQARYGSALRRCRRDLSDDAVEWLRKSPPSRVVRLGEVSLRMAHGAPWNPLEGRVYPDFTHWGRFDAYTEDVVLLGHTHYAFQVRRGEQLIVNPGSVGQPRDGDGASFAELDLDDRTVTLRRVTYNPEVLIQDAQVHDPTNRYLVEVLRRGYS